MEVFQNGVWSASKEPIYQIGEKQKDGSMKVVDSALMTKAEAEKKLAAMKPKKEVAKEAPVKKAAPKKKAK